MDKHLLTFVNIHVLLFQKNNQITPLSLHTSQSAPNLKKSHWSRIDIKVVQINWFIARNSTLSLYCKFLLYNLILQSIWCYIHKGLKVPLVFCVCIKFGYWYGSKTYSKILWPLFSPFGVLFTICYNMPLCGGVLQKYLL